MKHDEAIEETILKYSPLLLENELYNHIKHLNHEQLRAHAVHIESANYNRHEKNVTFSLRLYYNLVDKEDNLWLESYLETHLTGQIYKNQKDWLIRVIYIDKVLVHP